MNSAVFVISADSSRFTLPKSFNSSTDGSRSGALNQLIAQWFNCQYSQKRLFYQIKASSSAMHAFPNPFSDKKIVTTLMAKISVSLCDQMGHNYIRLLVNQIQKNYE